ncbi:hypothetical protein BU26DRAFT_533463 [Trematosphaeria pertusa]|uniref:Ornithine decarboxylase antizyme n=1 Tax=Trematosphaeria pertusa TaxID=390896 RepID=A0A6A6I4C1_9PLEO|nr:uncharacterized protein BU26DRAFT_533463 [Trematosphaeria pertusa]KAF2244858.1 hypothetical protein BU26DRAFT_533463 [Trematosphaeria pertusa]
MAIDTNKRSSSSSSNYSYCSSGNVRATCYTVNARTTALQGFHYSTTGAGGAECPPLAARHTSTTKLPTTIGRARRGGAACTIAGECERLFCGTLRSVFLGEGNLGRQDPLAMGVRNHHQIPTDITDYGVHVRRYSDRLMDSPSPEMVGPVQQKGLVSDWIEVWDYVGGIRFRGFIAEKEEEKAMFVFFDQNVVGGDLKAGLMALLELCEIDYFSCSRLVVCLDRETDRRAMDTLTKDLGWIGFQLTTLNDFTSGEDIISDQWIFMDMET